MNRQYNLKLDLQFRCNNSVMKFDEFDNNTSDFFIRVTRAGELIDISKAIVTLVVIKPDNSVDAQFVDIDSNRAYCDLKPTMKNIPGKYEAIASITVDGETVNTDIDNPIIYEVTKNKFLRQLNEEVKSDERFTILTDVINRLSSIETNESTRIENENNRAESEKIREQAIEKIKNDTTKLIADTKKEIAEYKNAKDTAINDDLSKYKEAANQSIDNYKSAKDTEINNSLGEYKTNTTDDIEEFKNIKSRELDNFKNTKNSEIDDYKREKDLAINQYVENKNLALNEYVTEKNSEIDKYKEAKDKEIDSYKSNKDTLINNKITEVEEAKQNIISTANNKISELDQAKTNMQNDVNSKIEEADNRILELQNFESQLEQIENKNIEQDTRLKEVEYKNKVQDVFVSGLFNENNDKRLSIEGTGNSLKLEGSKKGLVTVDKVVGDTLVNIGNNIFTRVSDTLYRMDIFGLIKPNATYSVLSNLNSTKYQYALYKDGATPIKDYSSTSSLTTFNYDTNDLRIYVRKRNDYTGEDNTFNIDEVKNSIVVLEGDYTNKTIPSEYFEGMQSTFENQLVTQEMVDSGEELAENLGKYKCVAKVRGKNLANELINYSSHGGDIYNTQIVKSENGDYQGYLAGVKPNTSYAFTKDRPDTRFRAFFFINNPIENPNEISIGGGYSDNYAYMNLISPPNARYCFLYATGNYTISPINWCQIEEGTQATPYEPYYKRTQTVYLNSPPHKGDEIVWKEDGLYHYHKMGKGVLDGSDGEGWANGLMINNRGISYVPNSGLLEVGVTNRKALSDKWKVISGSQQTLTGLNQIAIQASSIYSNYFYVSTDKATIEEFKADLHANPVTLIYELAEPYYEKISDDKLLLEIPNSATLTVESVIPCQSISASYTGGVPSLYGMETDITTLQDTSVDIIATSWDTDFRVCEIEWTLEELVGAQQINLLSERGINTMALSRFEQAKIIILGDAYYRPTFEKQLATYLKRGYLTQEEYDILIAMMDARETIEGE